jgi:hypothetical protein
VLVKVAADPVTDPAIAAVTVNPLKVPTEVILVCAAVLNVPATVVAVTTFAVKDPLESRVTIVEAPLAEAAVVRAFAIVPVEILEALIAVKAEPSAVITPALNSPEAPRRTIVEAPLAVAAVVLAFAIVPEETLDALIEVSATPLPETEVAVIAPAPKPPDESLRTIVEAPLAVAAVVLALSIVPDEMLEALILVSAAPLPLKAAEIVLAPKLPVASRNTIVLALLDVLPVVRALSMVPLEILEALMDVKATPLPETLVNEPVVAVTVVALTFVKAPVFGVEPPIVTLLREPPVIATALAF